MTLATLRQEVAQALSADRLSHTLAVEEEVLHLGTLFALPADRLEKLRVAALLHDITKEIDTDGQLTLCRQYDIVCPQDAVMMPQILHAVTGASVAADRFGALADEMVCRAIASHTTGRAGMKPEELLLFTADYIEPTRRYARCRAMRERFYEAFPETALEREKRLYTVAIAILEETVLYLISKGAAISPDTIEARNDLLSRLLTM